MLAGFHLLDCCWCVGVCLLLCGSVCCCVGVTLSSCRWCCCCVGLLLLLSCLLTELLSCFSVWLHCMFSPCKLCACVCVLLDGFGLRLVVGCIRDTLAVPSECWLAGAPVLVVYVTQQTPRGCVCRPHLVMCVHIPCAAMHNMAVFLSRHHNQPQA